MKLGLTNEENTIARRHFVGAIAGVIAGLGIADFAASAESEETHEGMLDESYLEKGLLGMARSSGWFNAHLGAAVIAGYYMCRENSISPRTIAGIKKQLDALILTHKEQFTPFPPMEADSALIEDLPTALMPAVEGGLRAHGHAVIYTALSTRALRDVPHMATPTLIRQLCAHIREIAKLKPAQPKRKMDATPEKALATSEKNGGLHDARGGCPDAETSPGQRSMSDDGQSMIDQLFDSLARFKPLLGRPSVRRPNFTHMVTHTEALMTLQTLGYRELAKIGLLGLQAHIDASVPDFDPAAHPLNEHRVSLEDIMDEGYWDNKENQQQWNNAWNEKKNPNGYWVAFGHLFKVLYSYQRLIGHVKDSEKVRLCSEILLERYINPDVQGG